MSDVKPGERIEIVGERVMQPLYGENPQQESFGLYVDPDNDDPLAISRFELVVGTDPSHNNICGIDDAKKTIVAIAAGLDKNGHEVNNIAIGAKHGDACGAAIEDSPARATERMLTGDRVAIFGGVAMMNFPITEEVAEVLLKYKQKHIFLDVVTAPAVDEAAIEPLERKAGKLRVLTNPALGNLSLASMRDEIKYRQVTGGWLVQRSNPYIPDFTDEDWLDRNGVAESPEQERDIILAWGIGSTSRSNTITLVKNGMLLANGTGQQDRVGAVQLAKTRAGNRKHSLWGAVAYSDSFFPFPDGPQELVDAEVEAVFTTTGSQKDQEVMETFKQGGVRVFTVPDKEGRGFDRH